MVRTSHKEASSSEYTKTRPILSGLDTGNVEPSFTYSSIVESNTEAGRMYHQNKYFQKSVINSGNDADNSMTSCGRNPWILQRELTARPFENFIMSHITSVIAATKVCLVGAPLHSPLMQSFKFPFFKLVSECMTSGNSFWGTWLRCARHNKRYLVVVLWSIFRVRVSASIMRSTCYHCFVTSTEL